MLFWKSIISILLQGLQKTLRLIIVEECFAEKIVITLRLPVIGYHNISCNTKTYKNS